MGLRVSPEELAGKWSLSFSDLDFVNAKPAGSRFGLAVQLRFFAANGFSPPPRPRFPRRRFPIWPTSLASAKLISASMISRGVQGGGIVRRFCAILVFAG